MKLCYRGIDYEYAPPAVRIAEGEIGGEYRGSHWRFHVLEEKPVPQPVLRLVYRGVAYSTGRIGVVAEKVPAIATPATQPKLDMEKLLSNSRKLRQSIDAVAQTHLNNMRSNLKHRLQVARDKGDQELVRLLEIEEEQMA